MADSAGSGRIPREDLRVAAWKRVATAAVLIPLAVFLAFFAPLWLLAAGVAVVVLLSLAEFFRLAGRAGFPGFLPWTALCSLLLLYVQWRQASLAARLAPPGSFPGDVQGVLFLFLLGLAVAAGVTKLDLARRLAALLASAGGMLLVALPLSYLIRIAGPPAARPFLLLLLVLIWAGDTLAFLVGRSLGRLPMAPALSPQKTWEGAVANLLGSLIVGLVALRWLPVSPLSILLLVMLANLAGQAGDLLESAYKRSASVKDSGRLLPGHGGMLDRVDSLVLAGPMVWWCLLWLLNTGRLR